MSSLPDRKAEAWRWADLASAHAMIGVSPPEQAPPHDADAHWLPLDGARHLFVGGRGQMSGPVLDVAGSPAHPLADLATGSEAVTLDIPADSDGGTVQLLHLGTAGAAHGRTTVRLGAGARLVMVETLADSGQDHWLNHRFDAEVGEGAHLIRVVRMVNRHGLASDRAWARLAANARLDHLVVGAGTGAARADVEVALDGADAFASANGVLVGDATAHIDVLTSMSHRVPNTRSQQVWRLVAASQSRLSVAGGVNVNRGAQKTDAEQSLKALVLDRTASANLKPELEIFADDVKCAHGCTVGELDKAALYYLQSRGLSPAEARALLTHAFMADALAGLPQPLSDLLDQGARRWLEAHA